jgi:hypothetical protein
MWRTKIMVNEIAQILVLNFLDVAISPMRKMYANCKELITRILGFQNILLWF